MSCNSNKRENEPTFTITLPKSIILNMAGNLFDVTTGKQITVDDITPEIEQKAIKVIQEVCQEAIDGDYFDSIWDALPIKWQHCEDDGMMEVALQGKDWAFVSITELLDNGFKFDMTRGVWKDAEGNLPNRSNLKTVED